MNRHDFLVEIGAEEMPPKSLVALGEAFRDGVVAGLAEAGLSHGAVQAYFTPRRLAVGVQKLLDRQPEQRIERRGPPIAAAFDAAGKPTRAATAFAESCGVKVEELTRIDDNKGQFLFCRTTRPGEAAARLLPGIVQAALDELPIARRMRWGAGDAEFVRPVHWIVMLHGDADPLVPLGQSEIFLTALKKAGVEAELVVIKGGGHGGAGFASKENLRKIEAFFEAHLRKK